jgi:hypothetical protein
VSELGDCAPCRVRAYGGLLTALLMSTELRLIVCVIKNEMKGSGKVEAVR